MEILSSTVSDSSNARASETKFLEREKIQTANYRLRPFAIHTLRDCQRECGTVNIFHVQEVVAETDRAAVSISARIPWVGFANDDLLMTTRHHQLWTRR
jgi:hypothetical protein